MLNVDVYITSTTLYLPSSLPPPLSLSLAHYFLNFLLSLPASSLSERADVRAIPSSQNPSNHGDGETGDCWGTNSFGDMHVENLSLAGEKHRLSGSPTGQTHNSIKNKDIDGARHLFNRFSSDPDRSFLLSSPLTLPACCLQPCTSSSEETTALPSLSLLSPCSLHAKGVGKDHSGAENASSVVPTQINEACAPSTSLPYCFKPSSTTSSSLSPSLAQYPVEESQWSRMSSFNPSSSYLPTLVEVDEEKFSETSQYKDCDTGKTALSSTEHPMEMPRKPAIGQTFQVVGVRFQARQQLEIDECCLGSKEKDLEVEARPDEEEYIISSCAPLSSVLILSDQSAADSMSNNSRVISPSSLPSPHLMEPRSSTSSSLSPEPLTLCDRPSSKPSLSNTGPCHESNSTERPTMHGNETPPSPLSPLLIPQKPCHQHPPSACGSPTSQPPISLDTLKQPSSLHDTKSLARSRSSLPLPLLAHFVAPAPPQVFSFAPHSISALPTQSYSSAPSSPPSPASSNLLTPSIPQQSRWKSTVISRLMARVSIACALRRALSAQSSLAAYSSFLPRSLQTHLAELIASFAPSYASDQPSHRPSSFSISHPLAKSERASIAVPPIISPPSAPENSATASCRETTPPSSPAVTPIVIHPPSQARGRRSNAAELSRRQRDHIQAQSCAVPFCKVEEGVVLFADASGFTALTQHLSLQVRVSICIYLYIYVCVVLSIIYIYTYIYIDDGIHVYM